MLDEKWSNPWETKICFPPNEWTPGAKTSEPLPSETFILNYLPISNEPIIFWNELVDFLVKRSPSIIDPRPKSNDSEIQTLVEEFCRQQFPDPVDPEICVWLAGSVQGFVKRVSIAKGIQRLSSMLKGLNLDFDVDDEAVPAYLQFREDYDLSFSDPGSQWLSGESLLARWNMAPGDFVDTKNVIIPSYLWHRGRKQFECVTDQIRSYQVDASRESPGLHSKSSVDIREHPSIWHCVPQWRYFLLADVQFFEKISPDLSQKISATLSCEWFSFKEILDRWRTTAWTVEEAVRKKGLPAYILNPLHGIVKASDDQLTLPMPKGPPIKELCLFRRQDIRSFERKNKKALGLNERSLDRIQIEELVKEWVSDNPELRTGEAVEKLKATHLFDHFSRDETLREKVRPFVKNHTHGPRKKS